MSEKKIPPWARREMKEALEEGKIKIPHEWKARKYQLPLWYYLRDGVEKGKWNKRAVVVWHRRAGKDSLALNWTAAASQYRRGVYWHMLPSAKQGRKVVWDGIDKQGRRIIDQVFPPDIRKAVNQQEMRIELQNGSIWQVVGSDNYDSLVGANPVGVVFSEYSVANPAAWNFIRPILAENGGWALFIYTPRGRNHGYDIYKMALENDDWFSQIMTIKDSKAFDEKLVDMERKAGMPEAMIQQEFYCSFDAAIMGAYYGEAIKTAKDAGRVSESVTLEPSLKVNTAWDLGIDDATAIWFFQVSPGGEIRVIDYHEGHGGGIHDYAKVLEERGYVYDQHLLPHDVKVRELGTGRSRLETFERLGIRGTVVPRLGVEDGVEAVRNILPLCWFNEEKTRRGLDALEQYRQDWDEKHQTFKRVHDWTSHAADAFRYLAVGLRERRDLGFQFDGAVDWDPFDLEAERKYVQRFGSEWGIDDTEDWDPYG